ncbi:MAG: hypothetical protein DIZ78_03540 [endosymbiont of Escarpia spicata]|uniref:SGNH hydrolase-type esterase domain-containing protein n=1 Tax=endosymbiont of Escarpia spicata TaxID=2200908 RepID=A0A370DSF6_9GAMM|nr:MAG: hypothetical protein DIZ78_03540 [endosymbiont of Escarpia spicata]
MSRDFRANVVTWADLNTTELPPWADPAYHDWKILAEGDSWFTIGGIPTSNLLFSMRFSKSTLIVNCAQPGDTVKNLSQIAGNAGLRRALSVKNGEKWDLILLSGGGNDLSDEAGEILINPGTRPAIKMNSPEAYCDQDCLNLLLIDIQDGYRRIVQLRDRPGAPSAGVPIVCHTYDYPTPNNSPARFFGIGLLGPWLFRAFNNDQIPQEDWIALTDYLFEKLAEALLELSQPNGTKKLPNFHVVDTRNTLQRAELGITGESNDWLNEIHANGEGYAKIGNLICDKAETLIRN